MDGTKSMPTSDIGVFVEVITTVEWFKETRLLSMILTLYVTCAFLTYKTWQNITFQCVYFTVLCAAIYCAEYVNAYAAQNQKYLSAKFQYFDSFGLFISVIYSFPLLLNLIIILLRMISATFSELVKVKRLQLKREQDQESKKKK